MSSPKILALLTFASAPWVGPNRAWGAAEEASPADAEVTPPESGPVSELTLKNGLRVRLEPDPAGAEVAVCTSVRVPTEDALGAGGSLHKALARWLEVGNPRGRSTPEDLLRRRGGTSSVQVLPEAVTYCSAVPAPELPFALWLAESRFLPLAGLGPETLLEPGPSDDESAANVAEVLERKLKKLVFLGQFRTSESSESTPTRAELEAFRQQHYVASNATLAISGGFDVNEARALVAHHLGGVATGTRSPAAVEHFAREQSSERFSIVFDSRYKTPAVAYGWALPEGELGDRVRIALSIVASPQRLGARIGSAKGPASEIAAHCEARGPHALGSLFVLGRYSSAPEFIERELDRALAELSARAPAPEEIATAEQALRAKRDLERVSPLQRAEEAALGLLLGDPIVGPTRFRDASEAKTFEPEQIRAAAAQILVRKRRSVVEFYPKGWKDPWETPMPTYHIVSAGENLTSIAKAHGTQLSVILSMNKLNAKSRIFPGDKLRVPRGKAAPKLKAHTIKKGETLSHLAARYGVSVRAIAEHNGLGEKHRLRVGQTLEIPNAPAASKDSSSRDGQGKDAPGAEPTPTNDSQTHVVRPGETLSGIAHHYHVGTDELAAKNGLGPKALVRVGQKLKVPVRSSAVPSKASKVEAGAAPAPPTPQKTYTVRKGDSLTAIAHRFHVSVAALRRENHLSEKRALQPGQKLIIPSP